MRILVIRKHNHIGDMLCSLPMFAALKKRYETADISLLASPTSWPVPLRELNPYLNHVYFYRKNSMLAVLRLQLFLRRSAFDLVLVPSTIRLSRTSHITARLTGARSRVGVGSIDRRRNPSAGFLTRAIDVAWENNKVHQVYRNLDIAAAAGCDGIVDPLPYLRSTISTEAQGEAMSMLSAFSPQSRIVGVHAGAGKVANIWPVERFAAVLEQLHAEQAISVLLSGGPSDTDVVSGLAAALDSLNIPTILVQPLSVLAAASSRLGLFLTNDTGVMHVAAFSGAAVVSLHGPTPAWEWAPLHARCSAIQSDTQSMHGISVDEVLRHCRDTLAMSSTVRSTFEDGR
jgi:heptosyltransferase III